MDIIRVEQDGVEFFTVNATGRCGTSLSGVGRINGVQRQSISDLIDNVGAGKITAECLKPFLGKDMRVQFAFSKIGSHTHITWLDADFVAAITEYYAFESPRKTKEALFAYRKFAKMGVERWIQGITGWKPAEVQTEPEILIPDVNIPHNVIQALTSQAFSPTAYRLCLNLHQVGQQGERPTVKKICRDLKISRPTYHKTIHRLNKFNLLPSWFEIETRNYPERIVRDWLHSQLGGQVEAPTIYGPIDLLTDSNLIEVKAIEDWKDALGHVMVKGLVYPKRFKAIMLFGDKAKDLTLIREACDALDVSIGFQLIKYIYDDADEILEIQRQKIYC